MNLVTSIELHGYKSIKTLPNLSLNPVNVLIGANGAGKSNFISFFKLLNWMASGSELQYHISRVGGANSLLHDGARTTTQIHGHLIFETDRDKYEYQVKLSHAAPDTLVFSEEKVLFEQKGISRFGIPIDRRDRWGRLLSTKWIDIGSGHRESQLTVSASEGNKISKTVLDLLSHFAIYHFHDTSETSRIKQKWDITDSLYLRDDGANLSAFLFKLREERPKYYQRIVTTIQQMAPFFVDFVLEPEYNKIYLRWRERGTDLIFGAHQASDGTLRAMALVTLLLQPKELLPNLIIIDEPELGLHPYAIEILAGLLKGVASNVQVIVSTQSAMLLNYFEPEQVIVVNRKGRESTFSHLDTQKLKDWLKEYSLAELWQKNVIEGTPA